MSTTQPYPEPMRARYGERFRCIGAACEENCCQGWGISIDQATFQRYADVPEIAARIGGQEYAPEDSRLIAKGTALSALRTLATKPRPDILVRLEPTSIDHARVQLLPSGLCPFLDADSLCGIQKRHGEGLLPEVCASYPRAQRNVFGTTERALHLSCPEAARLVLLDPGLLDSEVASGQHSGNRGRYTDRLGVVLASDQATGRPESAGADGRPPLDLQIRTLVLLLLTDRRYPLSQRLFLLGIFCSRLGQALAAQTSDGGLPGLPASGLEVARLVADYAAYFDAASLAPTLDAIQPRPDQQLVIVFELLRLRLTGQTVQPRLLDCLQRFELGLHHPAAPASDQLHRYVQAAERYYHPLMERHPYVLENYLANYVFKNRFPFGHGIEANGTDLVTRSATRSATRIAPMATAARRTLSTPQMEHLTLSVHYTLVRALLIGISAHHREAFALSHVVELIQCLSKAIDHNPAFLSTIERYVIERRLDTHEGIATLVF